jgi:serine/threonine-protein kinase SRPK3
VLKVHVNTPKHIQELEVYRYLAGADQTDHGRQFIRQVEDSFTLKSNAGEHEVFIMTPLGMSLKSLQDMQPNGTFQQILVVSVLNQVLVGLNFLHEADVIHTGQ